MKVISKIDLYGALWIVALCSLAGALSPFYWFLDLFNHFRPQAVIAGGVLLVAALYVRERRGAVFALAIIIINLGLMVGRLMSFPVSPLEAYQEGQLSILSSNVHTENKNHEQLLRLVQMRQPDVFIALEVDDAWMNALKPLEKLYRYHVARVRKDNFGMVVFAKAPFEVEALPVGDESVPMLRMDFSGYTVIAAHPVPPMNRAYAEENVQYIANAAKAAASFQQPVIIAGDLNATLWSDHISPLVKAGLHPANARGIGWTWPAGFWPLAIEIDHFFVRGILVKNFEVLADIGSDHYPISMSFSLPEKRK